MRILVISSNYPSPASPQLGTFVYKLIQEFVRQENEVIVISSQKYSFKKKRKMDYGDEQATVYRPKRLSFSNKKIGFVNTFHLTNYFQASAIKRTIERLGFSPEVIYCHFIISAINYFQAHPHSRIPVYIAVGEYNNIDVIRNKFSPKYYNDFLKKVKGFIAVSPQVEEKLLSFGVPQNKIIVEPNATDLHKFKPREKTKLRKHLGLPLDKKIVLFAGRFIESKGPLRLQKALDLLDDDIVAVFIGKGPQQIDHPKAVFSGTLIHDKVAEYMAASDVFVLPTLHEGSSNVIIEAMASGLPIVSSDIPEIKAQCTSDYAFLINPMSVSEIASALNSVLKNEEVRLTMGRNALEMSKKFDISGRAKRILTFINGNGD